GEDCVATDDRWMCKRTARAGVNAQGDIRVEDLEERVEVAVAGGGEECVDDALLLSERGVRLGLRAADAAACAARQLASPVRAAAHDRSDLVERHGEHVMQDERETLRR